MAHFLGTVGKIFLPISRDHRNFAANNSLEDPREVFLPRGYFLFATGCFLLSAQKKFVTKFVTLVTKSLTHITKFVIHVTNFVTNFFL